MTFARSTLAVLTLAFALSCATMPVRPDGYGSGFLPASGVVYGQVNVSKVPQLKALFEAHPSLKEVGSRTKRIWISLNLEELKPNAYSLSLVGDFPKGAVGLALDWNSNWQKSNQTPQQWAQKTGKLKVTVPEDGVVLASNKDFVPEDLVWKSKSDQELPVDEMARADVALVFLSPGKAFFGDAGARLIQISQVELPLQVSGDELTGPILFKMPNEKAAQSGSLLLKLALGLVQANSPVALLKNVEWSVQGNVIYGTNFSIKIGELVGFAERLLPQENKP